MPQLIVEFNGDDRFGAWDDACARACQHVADETQVAVVDCRAVGDASNGDVRLLLRGVVADELHVGDRLSAIGRDGDRQRDDPALALGVSPVGPTATSVTTVVSDALGPRPDGVLRWVEASESTEELESHVTTWLRRSIAFRIGVNRSVSSPGSEEESLDAALGPRDDGVDLIEGWLK